MLCISCMFVSRHRDRSVTELDQLGHSVNDKQIVNLYLLAVGVKEADAHRARGPRIKCCYDRLTDQGSIWWKKVVPLSVE